MYMYIYTYILNRLGHALHVCSSAAPCVIAQSRSGYMYICRAFIQLWVAVGTCLTCARICLATSDSVCARMSACTHVSLHI